MKRFRYISVFLAALIGTFALSSCKKDGMHSEKTAPQLFVTVYIPQPVVTKADVGTIRGYENERKINELVLWVFEHDKPATEPAFATLRLSGAELEAYNLDQGYEAVFSFELTDDLATSKPSVDVYALANPSTAMPNGWDTNWESLTRNTLNTYQMSGNRYGLNPLVTEVPSAGLPYSGVALETPIGGTYPVLNIGKVVLTRTVSKFRLLLSRVHDDVEYSDDFAITGISIDGNQFSEREFVFNNTANPYKIGAGYLTDGIVFPNPTLEQIAINEKPVSLYFQNSEHPSETADQYWQRLDAAVANGDVTEWAGGYLRESDKKLSGKISYIVGGVEKTATFSMDQAGDFARNHIWLIYAYFTGGKLVVKPTILPWTAGNDRFTYFTQGSTAMVYSPYLRYTPSTRKNDWSATWVALAYGFEDDGVTPSYSPKLTIKTNNRFEIRMSCNNPSFQFVIVDPEHPEPTIWPEEFYNIPEGAYEFSFYLLPSQSAPANEFANVVLTVLPSGGQAPYLLNFNHDLPGKEDHTSILFRRIPAADYAANKDNTYTADGVTPYWLEGNN